MIKTKIIVLKKLPYRESSLIINGLSPDFGRLDLLAKGALKENKGKFPAIDLFQELKIEFNHNHNSTMQTIFAAELLAEYSSIAKDLNRFVCGMTLCKLVLFNSHPGVPAPLTYTALNNAARQLAAPGATDNSWTPLQTITVIKAVYLHENGLLPNHFSDTEQLDRQQREFMQALLDAALNSAPLPQSPPEYWEKLNNWFSELYKYHDLKIDDAV